MPSVLGPYTEVDEELDVIKTIPKFIPLSEDKDPSIITELKCFDPRFNRDIRIPILLHDQNYLVINKPWDLRIDGPMINTPTSPTVEAVLYSYFPHVPKFYLCHQLDHGTSGIHVWGKSSRATGQAGKLFNKRRVQKTYVALLRGHMRDVGEDENGCFVVEKPLARVANSQLMCIGSEENPGKESRTFVKILQRGYYFNIPVTHVELKPITGRQHQLRLHTSSLGYPILGDISYEKPRRSSTYRMFLHARKLELFFESPVLKVEYPREGLVVETEDPFEKLVSSTSSSVILNNDVFISCKKESVDLEK